MVDEQRDARQRLSLLNSARGTAGEGLHFYEEATMASQMAWLRPLMLLLLRIYASLFRCLRSAIRKAGLLAASAISLYSLRARVGEEAKWA